MFWQTTSPINNVQMRFSKNFRMEMAARIGLLQPYCSKYALFSRNSDRKNFEVDIIPLLPVVMATSGLVHHVVIKYVATRSEIFFDSMGCIEAMPMRYLRWFSCRPCEYDRARGAFPFGQCIPTHFVHVESFTVHVQLCPNPVMSKS